MKWRSPWQFWRCSPRRRRSSSSGSNGGPPARAIRSPIARTVNGPLATKLPLVMSAALIAIWLMTSIGCASYKVISQDRLVRRVEAGQAFSAPVDGWFVPDARWLEIREALADKILELESKSK